MVWPNDGATSVRRRGTIIYIVRGFGINIIVISIQCRCGLKEDRCGSPICDVVHASCGDHDRFIRRKRSGCRVQASGSNETECRASSRDVVYGPGHLGVA